MSQQSFRSFVLGQSAINCNGISSYQWGYPIKHNMGVVLLITGQFTRFQLGDD